MAKKLKDWFDRDCAIRLGGAVKRNYPSFNINDFASEVADGISHLELKDRVFVMARSLRNRIPEDYSEAADILKASLGPPLQGETGMFKQGYWLMPVARLVEEFGLSHFDDSMKLCAEITRRNTAEYAVRPYIEADRKKAFSYLREWVHSTDPHIRRLASEGVRPYLPWAKQLKQFINDPEPALDLVQPLKADPSAYVRKSVANLINDVSRDHPEEIIRLVEKWSQSPHPHTEWIIRHGTRTLRKSGKLPGTLG